jgi:hypothetical protein
VGDDEAEETPPVNFGRLSAAALVAWMVHLGLTSLVWSVLLPGLLQQNAPLLRPPAEMNLVAGYAASLVGFFVFAYAYAKGYEGGAGLSEGLRFGAVVGLLLACFSAVWSYVMMPVSGTFAAAMAVDGIVEMAIYGMVVGLVYKPIAGRT